MSADATVSQPSLLPAMGGGRGLITSLVAVVLALAVGALLILWWGKNPVDAYAALISGSFGSWNSVAETLLRSIPLTLTGLAVALSFRGGAFNVGAEGQLFLGGTAAAYMGLLLQNSLPPALTIIAMIGASIVAGAAWSLLAGFLKLRFRASELISTIMLNYIAIAIVSFLLHGALQEAGRYLPQTDRLPAALNLPALIARTRLNVGFLITLVIVVVAQIALWRTVWGYQLRVAGLNARAAFNAGMGVTAIAISAYAVSGALAGLAGYMEMIGVQHRMIENLSPGYGYTGIIVALLGQTNPLGVLAAAILFAGLQVGASTMETAAGVPSTLATIVQALVVLFIIGRGTIDLLALRLRR